MTFGVTIPERGTFAAWRSAARAAISNRIPPDQVDWTGGGGLFAADPLPEPGHHALTVPAAFLKLADSVLWHSAPTRFSELYIALWRMAQHDGDPLSHADPLGRRLHLMAKSVGRDIHKMHAFVRFRELPSPSTRRRFAAWFEPDHHVLEPGAAFFVKRFADMDWMISTPRLTARFTEGELSFAPGGPRPDLPEDASEALWATYFANIFNPARIKIGAMQSQMPRKYWNNLPETRLIPEMLADAEARVARMHEAGASQPRARSEAISTRYRDSKPAPAETPATLAEARSAAGQCRRCHLCEVATQTVFGEGPPDARLMIVGEQPGDREDLEGRPFMGPAGTLLRQMMAEAGLPAGTCYLTNAVKHFKFASRGKRRLHQNPDRNEIEQCRWWIDLETRLVKPKLVVALGASAALSLTGRDAPLNTRRGEVEPGLMGVPVLVSWHPSYILRLSDPAHKAKAQAELTADLRGAALLVDLD